MKMSVHNFTKGKGLLHYLGTQAGRDKLMIASALTGTVIGSAVSVPQIFALDWLKSIFQLYKDGYPVKLQPHVVDLVAEVSCG